MKPERRMEVQVVRVRAITIARDIVEKHKPTIAIAIASYALAMAARSFYGDGPMFERFVTELLPDLMRNSPKLDLHTDRDREMTNGRL